MLRICLSCDYKLLYFKLLQHNPTVDLVYAYLLVSLDIDELYATNSRLMAVCFIL